MTDVVFPLAGMAEAEGTLLQWLRSVGDVVEADEPVAEIETDKAITEVCAPVAGELCEQLFGPGDVVVMGAVIARIGDPQGLAPSAAAFAPVVSRPAADRSQPVAEDRHEWLETMLLIREFEAVSERAARAGKIPGGMHSAAGQEGVAVGCIRALAPSDIVASSHRSHHHSLAKGLSPRAVMAELFGKVTGCVGGRGGHMHLADFGLGLFGSNGIVGGGLGIAMGAALAAQRRGEPQVALGFFGDGGANTGRVWEIVNLAQIWALPLVVVCENNLYAVETAISRSMASESVAQRAEGFGLRTVSVDGQDVVAVYEETKAAADRARDGGGMTFIEALTYRFGGHNTDDPQRYRDAAEVQQWRETADPIERLRAALAADGSLSDERYDEMCSATTAVVADALAFAEDSDWPDPATATHGVTGQAFPSAQPSWFEGAPS